MVMFKYKSKIAPIDSRIYKYWQALYMAFYSRKLYIDVAKRWDGFGVTYCLLCFLVFTVPYTVKTMLEFNQYVATDLLSPVAKIPTFKVINGTVIFDKEMPYVIKNAKDQEVVIIDTTGKVNNISKEYPSLVFLITKTKIFFKHPKLHFLKNDKKNQEFYDKEEISTHDLSDINDEEFNGNNFLEDSDLMELKNYLLAFVYPIVAFGLFGIWISSMLAFAILGQVASYAIFKYKITYKQTCRIAIVSSTIAIGSLLLLKTFDISSLKWKFFCMVLFFIYFSYAVLSVKRDSKRLVHY